MSDMSSSSGFRYIISIKAKYVPDPSKLQNGLRKQLSDEEFTVQLRNNVYTIQSAQKFELKRLAHYCGYKLAKPTVAPSPSSASSKAPSFQEIKVN
ncbi:hypothetical protein BD289DRAFT_482628 [Coniella lustricola]|uniref:Uncharacterized protein n=1 Tax=Coniella lustricola TaxID=2025994 RepID=A0A2T3A8B4_9PEZI|nr:hypothetical protein BD289DRAFT_482628 [Coniella lustricola]